MVKLNKMTRFLMYECVRNSLWRTKWDSMWQPINKEIWQSGNDQKLTIYAYYNVPTVDWGRVSRRAEPTQWVSRVWFRLWQPWQDLQWITRQINVVVRIDTGDSSITSLGSRKSTVIVIIHINGGEMGVRVNIVGVRWFQQYHVHDAWGRGITY